MRGFININKAEGKSSAQAVAAVKRVFKVPCGHMGTLDPMATGCLPVGLGKTTRLFPYLLDKEKTYYATFRFGETTDTLDKTGVVTATTDIIPDESAIKNALPAFVGKIEQIPPQYSAKCVDGKRGYQLARKGVEFTLPPKTVEVLSFTLEKRMSDREYAFRIKCRGGTYIRSLCRDLGVAAGSLAVMTGLTRENCGTFSLENSVTAEELSDSDRPEKYIIPPDTCVDFPKLVLTPAEAQKILDGVYEDYGFKDGIYRVYCGDDFRGIGQTNEGKLRIKAYVR